MLSIPPFLKEGWGYGQHVSSPLRGGGLNFKLINLFIFFETGETTTELININLCSVTTSTKKNHVAYFVPLPLHSK